MAASAGSITAEAWAESNRQSIVDQLMNLPAIKPGAYMHKGIGQQAEQKVSATKEEF